MCLKGAKKSYTLDRMEYMASCKIFYRQVYLWAYSPDKKDVE
jgi:hypothetical protein